MSDSYYSRKGSEEPNKVIYISDIDGIMYATWTNELRALIGLIYDVKETDKLLIVQR